MGSTSTYCNMASKPATSSYKTSNHRKQGKKNLNVHRIQRAGLQDFSRTGAITIGGKREVKKRRGSKNLPQSHLKTN